MTDTLYFIRMRGKILGPFSIPQLQEQRDRGYFSAVHEVSTDRRNWMAAGSIGELFPSAAKPRDEEKHDKSFSAAGEDEFWFYLSPGGDRTGPITGGAIQDMVLQGQLSSSTLVWKKGLAEWQSLMQAGLMPYPERRGKSFRLNLKLSPWWLAGGVAAAAIVVLAVWLVRRSSDRPSTEEIVKKTVTSIALVQGNRGSGTGFLARPGIVATNAHVVGNQFMERLTVQFTFAGGLENRPKKAKLLHFDPKRDLAILSVDTSLPPLGVRGDYQFRHGQYVLAIGYPAFGDEILNNDVTDGVMSSHATLDNFVYFKVTMSVNEGNSGGPVLDADAKVIGVVAAKARQKERMTFVIPASDLEAAIQLSSKRKEEEIEKVASDHRTYVVFMWLEKAMQTYGEILADRTHVKEMAEAIKRGEPAIQGLRLETQIEIFVKDKSSTEDLERNLRDVVRDSRIPPKDQERFEKVWKVYKDIKRLFSRKPTGSGDSEVSHFLDEVLKSLNEYGELVVPLRLHFGIDKK